MRSCTKVRLILFNITLLSSGCAGAPIHGAEIQKDLGGDQTAQPVVAVQPPPPAGSEQVKQASTVKFEALTLCDSILVALPSQQLALKKISYNRKQGGLLTTTIIGVAGSIVTAVIAGTQKADAAGSVDSKPVTIVGASTAGATALAGVISLFVVGSGYDDKIQQLVESSKLTAGWESELNTNCPAVSEANAAACILDAKRLYGKCDALIKTLPYRIPKSIILR
jgi:uncharacterized membrane protein YeaQ/YmgE (transglycosylase-associated protein family)